MTDATTATPEVRAEPDDELGLRLLRGRDGAGGLVVRLRVLPAALLLTALQLLATCWRLSRGWFWQDDFNILATAARRPLSPGLLFSNYNGHLIPGSWVLAWLFDRIAPMQWWPAAVVTAGFVLATDLAMLALLRRLFGLRPAVLLPYAIFCFSTLTLTSTMWWAASLEWLPVTLSLVLALWCHVGYLRAARKGGEGHWWAAGALLSVVFGLAFFEKALTTPVVLALFTAGWAVPGPLRSRPWRALARHWKYWLAHAVLVAGFLALYLTRTTIDTGPGSQAKDAVEVTRLMVFDTLLPSLVGGPWHWLVSESGIIAFADPPGWLVVLTVLLLVLAVAGSLLFNRGAWRAWALLLVFLAFSVALVIRARLGFIGPIIGRDTRYLTDLVVMAPLCLALAWLPVRGGLDEALASRPVHPGSGPARRRRAGQVWVGAHRARTAGLATLAIAVVVIGGVVSAEGFMRSWTRNPGQAYLTTLRHDLEAHHGPVYVFGDEPVPDAMMEPTFLSSRTLGWVTRPLPVRPVVTNAAPALSVVDAQGHLHNATIRGSAAVMFGPVCATDSKPALITLPTALPVAHWKLKLGYFANRQTDASVSVGNHPATTMRLNRGLNTEYISLYAGGSPQIEVGGLNQDASVCVGSATLGLPVAAG